MRIVTYAISLASLICAAGCGCGDTVAQRRLLLTEDRGISSGAWGPFEIDASQLPAAVYQRIEKRDACGNPVTELRISPNRPIKVVLMPSTQP